MANLNMTVWVRIVTAADGTISFVACDPPEEAGDSAEPRISGFGKLGRGELSFEVESTPGTNMCSWCGQPASAEHNHCDAARELFSPGVE